MSMKLAYMLAILLIAAGCVSSPPQQAGQNQTAPAAPGNATPQQAQANSSANDSQPYIPPSNPSPPQQPQASPYSGMDFAALTQLGVPLQCDIAYLYQGRQFTARAYLKGGSDIRVETVGGSGLSQCGKTIAVIAGTKAYVGCQNKTVMPSCDWFVSAYNPQVPGQSSTFDFSAVPASQISCSDWAFDPSYFSTPGRTCSLGG